MNVVVLVPGGYLNTHLAQPFLWLRYTSMFSYSLSALAIIEFQFGSPLGFVFSILVYVAASNDGLFVVVCNQGRGMDPASHDDQHLGYETYSVIRKTRLILESLT